MWRQKCFHRKELKLVKSRKAKKKNRTKICNITKASKIYVSYRRCWYGMSSVKNFMSYLKKLFAFLKVFKLLSMCAVLYPKQYRMGVIYVGGNRVNWTYWASWYIELQAIN